MMRLIGNTIFQIQLVLFGGKRTDVMEIEIEIFKEIHQLGFQTQPVKRVGTLGMLQKLQEMQKTQEQTVN
jgi:hypothetical protein